MDAGPASCPQVFVVDSQAPVNLRSSGLKHGPNKNKSYLLYLLVGLALLGVFIEAIFIYKLYHQPAPQADTHHRAEGRVSTIEDKQNLDPDADSNEIPPIRDKKTDNRPAAFLQGVSHDLRGDEVMQWKTAGLGSFVRGLDYNEGSLNIQTEGFYYIYSKVYFSEKCSLFKHQVKRRSPRYNNVPTDLMQGLRYSCIGSQKLEQNRADVGNSFLGGVFHLYRGDSVYVHVNDSSLLRTGIYDNFFGIFMI